MQVSGSCDRSSNLREATTSHLDSPFFNSFTVLFFHIFNPFFHVFQYGDLAIAADISSVSVPMYFKVIDVDS